MTDTEEWIVTKYDDFGEPLLRERKPVPEETTVQRYYRLVAKGIEDAPY